MKLKTSFIDTAQMSPLLCNSLQGYVAMEGLLLGSAVSGSKGGRIINLASFGRSAACAGTF